MDKIEAKKITTTKEGIDFFDVFREGRSSIIDPLLTASLFLVMVNKINELVDKVNELEKKVGEGKKSKKAK